MLIKDLIEKLKTLEQQWPKATARMDVELINDKDGNPLHYEYISIDYGYDDFNDLEKKNFERIMVV